MKYKNTKNVAPLILFIFDSQVGFLEIIAFS